MFLNAALSINALRLSFVRGFVSYYDHRCAFPVIAYICHCDGYVLSSMCR